MLSSQFVIRNNICRVLKMIIPVYNSSEEEIGSSTGVPGHSTMNPSSGTPYIIPAQFSLTSFANTYFSCGALLKKPNSSI